MEDKVILTVTVAQRDRIVSALEALLDEYNHLADDITVNRYLAKGFKRDALEVARLSEQVGNAPIRLAREEMDKQVRLLMDRGLKIDAIRLVRCHTMLGLKEAKDYVENLDGSTPR